MKSLLYYVYLQPALRMHFFTFGDWKLGEELPRYREVTRKFFGEDYSLGSGRTTRHGHYLACHRDVRTYERNVLEHIRIGNTKD